MKGIVYLIGAGPGDPGLMTVKGMECLEKADTIVYDRLANPVLLENKKNNCKLIYVGKTPKHHTKTQDEINEILFQEAKEGKIVTRLKGGDPYVFGRGGEEGKYLYERDIPFEVVPGITSAIGGLAYGGIPITHRGIATSFHVITGHLKNEDEELNWEALAALKGTMVFLMGVSNLQNIAENLIKNGKKEDTPAAIINWASLPKQKVVQGTLKDIYQKALDEEIKPPSLIVIGDVVGLREGLNFYENKALLGKNIVITRGTTQRKEIIKELRALGANVLSIPTIEIQPIIPNEKLDESIKNLKTYNHIVFTSVNGVNVFFERLFQLGYDGRNLANTKISTVGPSTSDALRKYGLNPDFMPKKYVGEELVNELKPRLSKDDKVLIPRSKNGRVYLVEELSKICIIDEVHSYETVKSTMDNEDIVDSIKELHSAYILFSSPTTFKNFKKILGEDEKNVLGKSKIVSIGPITSKTIEDDGYKVDMQPKHYTFEGIVETLINEEMQYEQDK